MRATLSLFVAVSAAMLSGCSRSTFMQSPWDAIPRATAEEIAKLHQPEALRADLDTIVALHERTCPNPYLRIPRDSVLALNDRLKASIDRPMTRRDFLPIVMELQAGYRSDHYAQWPPSEDLEYSFARGERFLPFRAAPTTDELVIVAVSDSTGEIEPGDTIVRIGNISAADYLARLRSLCPNETERYRDVRVREGFRYLSWAAGIIPPTEIEVVRTDGSRHTVQISPSSLGGKERTTPRSSQPSLPVAAKGDVLVDSPPFRCRLLPGDTLGSAPIALIDFPRMDGPLQDQWETFLDASISAARERGAAGLIVDIRQNGGGSTELGEALLSRLTDRPYRMNSKILWRKSPESDELFRMMAKPMWRWLTFLTSLFIPEYTKLEYGQDVVYDNEATGRPRVEPSFDGPTCLLIGDRTFSAAMDLADGVRTYDLMLTIGQPTGGVPNTLGDIGPFQLPNSRIPISFSMKLFVRASGDESDLGPVRPHIDVAPIVGRDVALERAIDEIRKRHLEQKQ